MRGVPCLAALLLWDEDVGGGGGGANKILTLSGSALSSRTAALGITVLYKFRERVEIFKHFP